MGEIDPGLRRDDEEQVASSRVGFVKPFERHYTRRGGGRLAAYVSQQISTSFRLLADHPQAGHSRRDLTSLPVKFWPVFSYLIAYDPLAQPRAIVRVLHGSRDIAEILRRAND